MSSFLRATIWSFGLNWGQQGITTGLIFVLAALLGPENYGIVAIALLFVLFLETISEQGLVVAIIQRAQLSDEHLHTAFFSIIALSILLFLGAIFGANRWAEANQLPELYSVTLALAPLVLIKGISLIPYALLRRTLNFRTQAFAVNISLLVGGVVGIILAVYGAGVWALVAQQLITECLKAVLFWKSCSYRPQLQFSGAHFLELWPVSSGSFVESIGAFVRSRSDAIIIGLMFGPIAVALYRIADRLMNLVLNLAMRPVSVVALPYLSRYQSDNRQFRRSLRKALHLSTGLTIPPLGLVAGLSVPIMQVLGSEWVPAATALSLLCVSGMMSSSIFFTPHVLNALGRPFLVAALTWTTALASVIVFVLVAAYMQNAGLEMQVSAMAASRILLMFIVYIPIGCFLLHRTAGITFSEMLFPTLRPLAAAGVGFVSGWVLVGVEPFSTLPALVRLAFFGSFGAGIVLLWVVIFDRRFTRLYVSPLFRFIHATVKKIALGFLSSTKRLLKLRKSES